MGLALLICIGILLRIVPIWGNNFPFAYDNAKDSLAILQMWVDKRPTLLGSVSSLEGLYQGPIWYYLALPLNILMRFHPLASVLTVMIFGIMATIVIYKYWGKLAALLFTISPGVISTQQTAWAPYITMFPAVISLIPLRKLVKHKSLEGLDFILLTLSFGLMLHTEIAFAVVFAICLLVILVRTKQLPNIKQAGVSLLVLLVLLLPTFAFEIKHNFLQTRSVIRFVTHFREESAKVSDNGSPIMKVANVTSYFGESFSQSLVPGSLTVTPWVSVLLAAIFLLVIYKNKKSAAFAKVSLFPLISAAFLLFLILPSKPFYLISLMPFWIVAAALALKGIPRNWRLGTLSLLVIGALANLYTSTTSYRQLANTDFILFSSQLKAVETAYKLTDGRAFASYQYLPEVYDFTYQVAYYTEASRNHLALPTEISYEPGQSAYNPWAFAKGNPSGLQILIVEADPRRQFFDPWWAKMTADRQFVATSKATDKITVYLTATAKPK